MPEDDLGLEREAQSFGRYLVGRIPPPELVDRYAEANRSLLTGPITARDAALMAFVRRRPWSVAFLDAASGLLRPGNLLRSKLLIMAAILETSPDFAHEFLPRTVGRASLLLRLMALGVVSAARVVVGTVLYAVAIRSRP